MQQALSGSLVVVAIINPLSRSLHAIFSIGRVWRLSGRLPIQTGALGPLLSSTAVHVEGLSNFNVFVD